MKAIGVLKYLPIEDKESFIEAEVSKPKATGRDLLVEVIGMGFNPVDTKVRSPKPKVEEKLRVIGWDAYGKVVEVGESVENFKVGDKVFYSGTIVRPGTNSEFHLVDERIVGFAPSKLKETSIASFPLVSVTAHEALFERLRVSKKLEENKGKTILIIGGAGGVGSVAIQLAKVLAGLTIVTTASRPESVKWCKEMGADFVIDHHKDMKSQLEALNLKNIDYIFCTNNTDRHYKTMVEIIKPQGSICTIVETSELHDLKLLQGKSISFSYELMFTRAMFQTEDMHKQGEILNEIAMLLDKGLIKDITTTVLEGKTKENLQKAHKMIEKGDMIGKVVVYGEWFK